MTTENTATLATTAEQLATARPAGRVALAPELAAELHQQVEAATGQDAELAAAVAEGDATAAAIAAGCPPQFHPGVPAEQAALLSALRADLGLDRAELVVPDPATDDRHLRTLRAIGCTLEGDPV